MKNVTTKKAFNKNQMNTAKIINTKISGGALAKRYLEWWI